METTFIALTNMSGIACASDRVIPSISCPRKYLSLGSQPTLPIPWDNIIEQYKLAGGPEEKDEFSDYASHFISFLATIPVRK